MLPQLNAVRMKKYGLIQIHPNCEQDVENDVSPFVELKFDRINCVSISRRSGSISRNCEIGIHMT